MNKLIFAARFSFGLILCLAMIPLSGIFAEDGRQLGIVE